MISNILIPRNIEGRKEKLRQDLIKLLSQEVIEGDLEIDYTFEGIDDNLIKVKEIHGDVTSWIHDYIPEWLKDVKIYGSFNCSQCNLKTLENSPYHIGKNFYAGLNQLTTLEGCPKYIGENFVIYSKDNAKNLKLPKNVKIEGNFVI